MKKALVVGVLAVLMATAMAASAPQPHVPFTDEDLESEESMWSLYQRWRGAVHTSSLDMDVAETESRFEAFKANARYVSEFNKKEGMTYKLALNKFADMTLEEFVAKYTGTKVDAAAMARAPQAEEELELAGDVAALWDWRQHGAVTPAREQESCWAFSAVGAVEGANAIATGKLVTLSEQQVLDCSGAGDCIGGGSYFPVLHGYAVKQGISPAGSYPPYEAKDRTCRRNTPAVPVVKMDGAVDVPASEAALKRSVYRAPVAVSIEATQSLQLYKEGVYSGPCGTTVNHGVLVVGYGVTRDNIKYWIIKNSWGKEWGDNGFGHMKRDVIAKEGLCGIAMYGVYSVKNGHKNCSYLASPAVVASY
uniref:Uncharacterized protein n=1 Tax=Oryza rufipogon TaxID=4529 RepID=A0A0E0QV55_ORYRU